MELVPEAVFNWALNPVEEQVSATDLNNGHKLLLETFYGSNVFKLVSRRELPPGPEGISRFRFETILEAVLAEKAHQDLPAISEVWNRCLFAIRRYETYRYIVSDEPDEDLEIINYGVAVLGGIAWHLFPNDTKAANFRDGLALHNRPSTMVVRRAPLFLSYFRYFDADTLIRFTFRDANNAPRTVDLNYPADVEGHYLMTVRLNEWPLEEELPGFTVQVVQGEGGPMYAQEFHLDRSYTPQERTYIFRNSMGGYETLVCTGISTARLEVEKSFASRAIPVTYSVQKGDRHIYKTEAVSRIKVNSGWLPNQEQAHWMAQELMLASEVYEIVGDSFLPVLVNTKSLEYREDDRFLSAIAFEVEYAFPTLASSAL